MLIRECIGLRRSSHDIRLTRENVTTSAPKKQNVTNSLNCTAEARNWIAALGNGGQFVTLIAP
jgi:hypothetical protein